jgi:nucleoside-diphosphate-sugar epimerase
MSKGIKANKKNIWVLGATGYVGQLVSKRLFSERLEGNWSGQLITMGSRRLLPWLMERTNFFLHPLAEIPVQLIQKHPPTELFHCARMAGNSDRSRKKAARKGHNANQRLLSLLQREAPTCTLVYCSGTLMYGNTNGVIDESAPLRPIAYARAYEYAERPWTEASALGEMDVRIARPAWILGPDSWFEHFFYRPAMREGKVPVYGDGTQRMSIISVEDCAGQLVHLMRQGVRNQHANLYGFEPVTQREFAQWVAELLGLETADVSAADITKKHGATVFEALTSNTPVMTKHTAWRESYAPVHTDLKELIQQTISQLQAAD